MTTTPPVESTATPSEQPTTTSKRAQVTAIVLVVIVVVGLCIQSFANMNRKETRDAKANAEEQAKAAAAAQGKPEARLIDFAEKQQEAAGAQGAAREVKREETRREAVIETLMGQSRGEGESSGTPQKTPLSVAQEFALAERLRALQAGTKGMGINKSGGATSPQVDNGTDSEIARVDAKIAELSKGGSDIEGRKRDLLARAQAAGIVLPDNIIARFGGGASAGGAAGAGRIPILDSGSGATQRQQDQPFGELASNRAARSPANAGPAPGEKTIPTGTIISAITDMEMISDYAGNWIALVQRPVYDSEMDNILFPAGTKIIGKSIRATGVNEAIQSRMGSIPLWAIRPDGKRIDFKRTAAMDSAGVAALAGDVDRHFLAQFMGVGAYAIIGIAPSTSNFGSQPDTSRDSFVREATGKSRDVGRAFAEKYLNIVPTIKVRAGTPIKIFIEDDIYVTPWKTVDAEHFVTN